MSVYRFGRFGALLKDDHPLALFAGERRLSPPAAIVWWWPWNWVVAVLVLPLAIYRGVRDWRKARSLLNQEKKEQ